MNKNNIILIGMPGCGKSTVGVVLAKALGFSFIDTDLLIQNSEKKLLHEIISDKGPKMFLSIENDVNSSINAENSVIATGGSAVYGEKAMLHLKSIGTVVYLRLPLNEIKERIGDVSKSSKRGIVMLEEQSIADLYNERTPLYEKYADIIIDTVGISLKDTVAKLLSLIDNTNNFKHSN